jgi:hypothetical protein
MNPTNPEIALQLDATLRTGDEAPLAAYLAEHSHLPGPRGNLELADAWAQAVEACAPSQAAPLWALCLRLASLSAAAAPVNDPREYVAFCGVRGLGALGASLPARRADALEHLHTSAADARWRLREAVAMALQRLLAVDAEGTLRALEGWIVPGAWLPMRAVAAGLAEPPLLQEAHLAEAALRLHRQIVAELCAAPQRRTDEFRALRQGLGYTLSVVVAALPEAGFAYLRELAMLQDRDVRWIVRENLKKNRLLKADPAQVRAVEALL